MHWPERLVVEGGVTKTGNHRTTAGGQDDKQEKPQAQGPPHFPVNSQTVQPCSGFIDLRR